ncbi:DUF3846 domain-containing protein [Subtercola lobariae]|uniref:DUF3846 domain-containing protein n=1 Tax=Subtercola lobariae TaxID=1588641 RepID=A0A917B281_9MICO|nr:DUF3846 domain-containing protein [Subtercola lobariae]GGF18451.1 hypothetical protein GCM10011399_10150 [Subtercola lobariae]
MPTGIFIPADDSVELTLREFSSLPDYQTAVGGFIEAVDLVQPRFALSTLIMNEEGKLDGLPINKRATLLLWIHQPALRFRDEIVGDAILVGTANIRGGYSDVPPRLRSLLFDLTEFTIETVSETSDSTKRVQHLGSFSSWVNAYVVALDVATAMPSETQVCVVPE